MRSLILLMLLALVPFRYAEALDDINTLDLNEGIDFTKPDMNEDAKGYRNDFTKPDEDAMGFPDDITTPDINEGGTGWGRSLDRRLGR